VRGRRAGCRGALHWF
jgi:hypothetical protein